MRRGRPGRAASHLLVLTPPRRVHGVPAVVGMAAGDCKGRQRHPHQPRHRCGGGDWWWRRVFFIANLLLPGEVASLRNAAAASITSPPSSHRRDATWPEGRAPPPRGHSSLSDASHSRQLEQRDAEWPLGPSRRGRDHDRNRKLRSRIAAWPCVDTNTQPRFPAKASYHE